MTVPVAGSYRDELLGFVERLAADGVIFPAGLRGLPGFERLVGDALAAGYLVESTDAEGFRIDFDAIMRDLPLCGMCSEPMSFADDVRAGRHLACVSDDPRTGDGTTPATLSRVCW